MMRTWLMATFGFGMFLLGGGTVAHGQVVPGATPYVPAPLGSIPAAGALPNFYNRQYQPLSPYLNLVRSGNPAVNYYYGVRPGQIANGQSPGGAAFGGSGGMNMGGGFVPALQQVAPGAAPVPEENPGAVPGFAPIGPASFSTGLTRFTGVYGGGSFGGGRAPNQSLPPASGSPPRSPTR